MKRFIILAGASVMLTVPTLASASPYHRGCGTSQDGFLLGPSNSQGETPYEVNGPLYINMTHGEAIRLARRQPVEEFNYHVTPTLMPCVLAEGIAESAGQAWVKWQTTDNGWVTVYTQTEGGPARIGRFHCTGRTPPGNVFDHETCVMHYPGGRVVGSFNIYQNPNY